MEDLVAKIEALPPTLQREVEDFVDFLRAKQASKTPSAAMQMDWRGALRNLRGGHTSVALQHEAAAQREG